MSRTTYDFSPLTDADYERARLCAEASALESSYDGRLPEHIADRIWKLRHENVTLPPATPGELQRDLMIARQNSASRWLWMKREAKQARVAWTYAHNAVNGPDHTWHGTSAVAAENRAVANARRWRDARKLVAYLEARLQPVAQAAE